MISGITWPKKPSKSDFQYIFLCAFGHSESFLALETVGVVAFFGFSFLGWCEITSYYLWPEIVRYGVIFEMSVLLD